MGRNYYCDYCDKRVRNDIQIRKKHIQGLQHQTAQSEHYAKFKSNVHALMIQRLSIIN